MEVVGLLLERGAKIEAKDTVSNRTCMHVCMSACLSTHLPMYTNVHVVYVCNCVCPSIMLLI